MCIRDSPRRSLQWVLEPADRSIKTAYQPIRKTRGRPLHGRRRRTRPREGAGDGGRPPAAPTPVLDLLGRDTCICTRAGLTCTVCGMATMNISAARENLPAAVDLARSEAVFIERYGRPAAVLLSQQRYEELTAALEEAEDVVAFDAAMSEEGANIPWEQVKADLGWV